MSLSDREPRYSRFAARSRTQHKRLVIYAVLLVVVVVAMLSLHGKARGGIAWVASFEEAQALARAEGKPIMAYFHTAGSDDCRRMEQETFADKAVIAESRRFVCVGVDGRANRELAERYFAIAYPAVAFIGPGGERLPVVINHRTPEQMVDWMQDALRRWRLSTLANDDTLPPRNADPARGETE